MGGGSIEVTVKTPSRLHFSMIDMRGDLGRVHGSVGVSIENPSIVIKAREAQSIEAKGSRANRVKEYAESFIAASGISGGVSIEVVSDILEHSGFGSGTQLALAVGSALSEIYNLNMKAEEIALRLNRSRRSGIGTYAFKHGGFIVDGGHKANSGEGIPPLLFRAEVPESWRFVVGVPEIPVNTHGSVETNAFKKLEPPPTALIGEISRTILMQMIPAIIEEDIVSFGEAMTSIDFKFGEFWLEIQGGRFSHPLIEDGIGFLVENGALGVGQSAWGPAFYGLTESESEANKLCLELESFLNEDGRKGNAFVAKPDNRGAVVKRIDV